MTVKEYLKQIDEVNEKGKYKADGTTFWKQFGKGKVNAEDGFFKDGDEKQFTTEDFRFIYKNSYLYVFQMRPSKNVKIKTLRKHNPHDYLIQSIELLGSDEKIDFDRNEEYLEINLKGDFKNDLPIASELQ